MNKLKKYNKTCKLLMILGMFLSMLMPTGGMTVEAEGGKNLGNIFSEANIYTYELNKENEIVNKNAVLSGSKIEVTDGLNIGLQIDWALKDNNDEFKLESGDFANFSIPKQFKLARNENGPLYNENGIEIGRYFLDEKTNNLKVVFNDSLADLEDRNGNVWVALSFDEDEFKDDTSQTIIFETEEEKNFEIILKPKEGSYITKSGLANKTINADSILWKVNVNTNLNSINNAEISIGASINNGHVKHIVSK